MNLNKATAADWPKCADFLRTLAGQLPPKVKNAFFQACTAEVQRRNPRTTRLIAERALQFGRAPLVVVREGMIKIGTQNCGFQPGPPFASGQELWITSIYFDAFEFGAPADHSKNARRLEGIVLHEAVHWVREQANASVEVLEGLDVVEAGQHFEQLAYNQFNCTSHEAMDALASITPSGVRAIAARRKR